MANIRYDQEPALVGNLLPTDIFCVSRAPFGFGAPFQKCTLLETQVYMQNNLYLSGAGDPTTATVGFLGQIYVNTTANTFFVLTDITGIVYTWVSVPSAPLSAVVDPTTATVGVIGQIYVNTATNSYWVLTDIVGVVYTWTQSVKTVTAGNASILIAGTAVNPTIEVNTLSGAANPTTSTVGVIGQIYINTSSNTFFICTDVTGIVYTWVGTSGISNAALLWNANTNTPTLVSSVGTEGDVYIVSVAGNTILDGVGNWLTGQGVIFTSGVWTKTPELDSQSIPYANSVGNLVSDATFLASNAAGNSISINDASTTTSVDSILTESPFNATIEISDQAVGIFKSYANDPDHFSTYSFGARGTRAAPLIVNNGDLIGAHFFGGYDGTTFVLNSTIASRIDVAPAVGNIKSNLEFAVNTGIAFRINSSMYGQYNDLFRITRAIGTGQIPSTVADPQMFFYPGKAAFRAGQVDGVQWDNANIGQWSTSFGQNCNASGQWSFSAGSSSAAGGVYSVAMGLGAAVTSGGGLAMGGFGATSSGGPGDANVVIGGNGNIASGSLITVVGGGLNTAAGTFTTILGSIGSNIAAGVTVGTVLGGQNNALTGTANYSVTLGSNTSVGNNYVVMVGASTGTLSSAIDQTFIVNAANGTGLNTNSPNSTLTVNGTVSAATTTITANYNTTTTACKTIFVNTATTAITITLDSTSAVNGREYYVKDISNNAFVNNITITPNGGKTIDGAASAIITVNSGSLIIISNGTNWFTI